MIVFNADLRSRYPWIVPWGSLHPDSADKFFASVPLLRR